MMGLNIIPTNNTSTQTQAANVLRGGGSCASASGETLVVTQQQQGEGELNDILDHFLMSFEQHINSAAREEASAQSSTEVAEQAIHTPQQQDAAELPANNLQPHKTQRAPQTERDATTLRLKSAKERKRTRRTPSRKSNGPMVGNVPPSGVKSTRVFPHSQDKQLQQITVVKLERRDFLPLRVNLQDLSSLSSKVTHTTTKTEGASMRFAATLQQQKWTKEWDGRGNEKGIQLISCFLFLFLCRVLRCHRSLLFH